VHEGHEHLGEELLASLGVPSQRSNDVEGRQQVVDEDGEAPGMKINAGGDDSKPVDGEGWAVSNGVA
jgi:hypothetical protein